jgi:hypothetical protein
MDLIVSQPDFREKTLGGPYITNIVPTEKPKILLTLDENLWMERHPGSETVYLIRNWTFIHFY